MLLVGCQEWHRAGKILTDEVLVWLSYGAKCKWLAYGSANATATLSSLLQQNPEWFILLVPGSPRQSDRKMVVVVVLVGKTVAFVKF